MKDPIVADQSVTGLRTTVRHVTARRGMQDLATLPRRTSPANSEATRNTPCWPVKACPDFTAN